MWLINARSHKLEEYYERDAVRKGYAILSHTWGEEEVTFADIQDLDKARSKRGYQKIEYTCQQALQDGLDYAWLDTCCIDKSSSAELSEAIQSMFRWYQLSGMCYAYLSDVAVTDGGYDQKAFSESRYFTRGWTLQELIAPMQMKFFGKNWASIGNRYDLKALIATTTGIGSHYLGNYSLISRASVAARMSWAAGRQTTRPEDRAYSLMGIFGVNIPLLYGESERAFQRLQEEIIRTTIDHSVLLWVRPRDLCMDDLLAMSPDDFAGCGKIRVRGDAKVIPFHMTNAGIQLSAELVNDEGQEYVVLDCFYEDDFFGPICLPVSRIVGSTIERPSFVAEHSHEGERYPTLPLDETNKSKGQPQSLLLVHSYLTEGLPRSMYDQPSSFLLRVSQDLADSPLVVDFPPKNHWNAETRVLKFSHARSDVCTLGYITLQCGTYYLTVELSKSKPHAASPLALYTARIFYTTDNTILAVPSNTQPWTILEIKSISANNEKLFSFLKDLRRPDVARDSLSLALAGIRKKINVELRTQVIMGEVVCVLEVSSSLSPEDNRIEVQTPGNSLSLQIPALE